MKFVYTADLHIHPFREYSTNNGLDRLADGLNVLNQACAFAVQQSCPLVIGGDLKYHKDKWYDAVLNGYLDTFAKYTFLQILISLGNHDGIKGQLSGLEAFRHCPNVTVFTKYAVTKVSGEPVLFCPWQSDWKDLPEAVAEAKKAKAKIVVGHAFLEGAAVGSANYHVKKGVPLGAFGLDPKDRVFDWGFFGDIHKQQRLRQFLANRKGKPIVEGEVWYPGSPYAQRKDEIEPDKGVLLVDLNASKVVTPIPLKAPQFIRLDLTQYALNKDTTTLEIQRLSKRQGDFVDVIAPHGVDPTILEQVRKVMAPRIFHVHIQPPKRESAKRTTIHAGMSNTELVREYLKSKPLPEGVPKSMLEKAGLMLLKTE